MKITTLNDITKILSTRGDQQYGGESVSQLEHALQCATLAEKAGATPELITASLLHDLGHLIHNLGEDPSDRGIDDRHEYRSLSLLNSWFSQAITEPIRLHVEAKRYLCAVIPTYYECLSPTSRTSLELQGGILSSAEAEAFIQQPYAEEAVKLRCWDEQAKVPNLVTPELDYFGSIINTVSQ